MTVLKSIIIAMSIVLIFSSAAIAAAPVVQITLVTNPITAYPGGDGYIQVNLKNTGTASALNIKATVTPLDTGIVTDQTPINIGGLAVGDSISQTFKFSVPSTTPAGLYRIHIEIRYCQDTGCSDTDQYAIINVQSQQILELTSITPNIVSIGRNTTTKFSVYNSGQTDISNVVLTWQEQNNLILPLGSSNRIVLPIIHANQTFEIPIEMVTSPSITPGAYALNIKMEYTDKSGIKQNISSIAGVIVGGAGDIDISMQEFSGSTITLSIANIGVNPTTSVSITTQDQKDFRILGAQTVFLSNMNPGDSTVATFNVVPLANISQGSGANQGGRTGGFREGAQTLHVTLSYTDTSGFRQSAEKDVKITAGAAVSTGQTQRFGRQDNTVYYFVAILVAVVVIVYAYVRFRRKKE
ncbi:MAG: hypothetical protein HY362_03090 [Candidatus Aenigmarchaeota archaeon]|nr:hypothetical protein [Candidatus Aenigmarchaeota archaeon]